MKKSFLFLLVVFAALAIFGAAIAADDVIKVGVFEPFTGENGGGGFQEVLGIRYANEVYKTIEVGGKTYTIELVEADNKSDKAEAMTAAESLIVADVVAVVGSYGSSVSIAAGPIFMDEEIPAVGTSCTNPMVTLDNDFYFRTAFLEPFQGTVLANYAFQHDAKTAAVITQVGDDYTAGLGSFFKNAFVGLGGEVISEEQYQQNQDDFKAILTNIKEANPDVIFAPSSIAAAPKIIQQARELGLTCEIMAGDTWENETIIENAGGHAEGIVFSTFFDESGASTDEAKKFVEGFKPYLVANNQPETIPAVSALGYDSYLAVYKAIEAADSFEPVAIRDALVTLEYEGVTGPIKYDENGDAIKNMAVIKTVKEGKFVFLENVQTK